MPNEIKKPVRKKTAETQIIEQKLAKGLGTLVAWQFKSKSWSTTDLKSVAVATKFPIEVKEIPTTNAMNLAISKFKVKDDDKNLITAKKVHEDNDVYTIALYQTELDSNSKKATGKTIDRIVFDSVSKTFLSKGTTEYSKTLCKDIEFRLEYYQGNEFRKWLIMPLINLCKPIKYSGGVYFIGSAFAKEIDLLESFCNAAGVDFKPLDQMSTDRTKKNIAETAKNTMAEDMKNLFAKFKTYKNRKRVRLDGRKGMEADIQNLRNQAEYLKDILDSDIKGILKTLSELDQEMEELNNRQPTTTQTSNKVLQVWKNAMCKKYELQKDGNVTGYRIPITDFEQLLIPKTAGNKFYWKPDQRLQLAVNELGYEGKLLGKSLILTPKKQG